MHPILTGALALLLAACAPPDTALPDTLVLSSDPELRRVSEELLPDLARRSGLELRAPVRVERRSREQLVAFLEAKLDEELPPELARRVTTAYALLGLVPPDLDLRSLLLSVYTEQVAGFYDPDSTALFVMEDQPAEALRTVLVHELVHAVQDQAADLDALTDRERGNDRQTAAQAAIEGHATLVMMEYLTEQLRGGPIDLSEIPDFGAQIRPALEAMRGQYPALAGAPRVIQEALLFPYLEGAGFVQALWQGVDGRPAPFGEHLPQSTEHILSPERFLPPGRDAPLDVVVEVAGVRTLHSDALGQLETAILLEERVGAGARGLAEGWGGDRYVLFETPEGEPGLVWFTVWDDAGVRDAFLDALTPHLDGHPLPATLESVELEGRPGAVLRVGPRPASTARPVPYDGPPPGAGG